MTNETEPRQRLTKSLLESLAVAPWITPTDAANVQWAIFLASELDVCGDNRQIVALGKLYESALHVLGLNPDARSAKTEIPSEEVTPLAVIKQIGQSSAEVADSKQTRKPRASKSVDSTKQSRRDASAAVAGNGRKGISEKGWQ